MSIVVSFNFSCQWSSDSPSLTWDTWYTQMDVCFWAREIVQVYNLCLAAIRVGSLVSYDSQSTTRRHFWVQSLGISGVTQISQLKKRKYNFFQIYINNKLKQQKQKQNFPSPVLSCCKGWWWFVFLILAWPWFPKLFLCATKALKLCSFWERPEDHEAQGCHLSKKIKQGFDGRNNKHLSSLAYRKWWLRRN